MSKQTDLINIPDAITVSGSNVGIGTSSPSTKLDVGGVIQFLDDNTPEIKIIDPDDSNYALIGYSDGTMTLSSNHGNEAGGANVLKMFTGGSERMRIDGSGHLLVGKSTSSGYTNGIELRPYGLLTSSRDSAAAVLLNRTTNDGDIISLAKDGATVGRIGSNGTASWIACPAGSGAGLRFDGSDNRIVPTEGDGTNRNAAVDLGYASSRFKDAYLSGGIYLGGTGSANKLEDYEEGTHTVSVVMASGTVGLYSNYDKIKYTKIGRVVNIQGQIRVQSISSPSGQMKVTLPFSADTTNDEGANVGGGVMRVYNGNAPSGGLYMWGVTVHHLGSEMLVEWVKSGQATTPHVPTVDEYLLMSFSYFTA